jgi:hypothetical protein
VSMLIVRDGGETPTTFEDLQPGELFTLVYDMGTSQVFMKVALPTSSAFGYLDFNDGCVRMCSLACAVQRVRRPVVTVVDGKKEDGK